MRVDPALDGRRRVELRQLEPAVAVRRPHEDDLDPDPLEPDDAVHPPSLDRCRSLALHLQTELHEEGDGSLEVVDDDADVVHPLNRHGRERM